MSERYVKGEYIHQSMNTDSPNRGELPSMSDRIACDSQQLVSIDEDVGRQLPRTVGGNADRTMKGNMEYFVSYKKK